MARAAPTDPIAILLDAIDQAYNRKAWHGPNLRGAIRRVTADEAAWLAGPGRRRIADLVAHAAYWKYTVRRRLLGLKRGGFALKGSNWFELESPWNDAAWKRCVALLDAEHAALRDAVAGFPPSRLVRVPPGSRFTYAGLIHGIACHDVYHAGQIQLLRRLHAAGG